jgi:hypothetical protein
VELPQHQRETVQKQVGAMLDRNPSFRSFPLWQRAQIARDTSAIVEAMVPRHAANGRAPQARGLEDVPAGTPPPDRWRPDERFRAEGIAAGVTQVGRMINEVNFPAFVASLVKGTFQAIVDASIQQMKAYGELVQSVAMSLNDFRDQNVSPEQGGQHLVSKYPKHFQMGVADDGEKQVQLRENADLDNLPNFMKDFGLPEPVTEIDDPEVLDALVSAARDEVARGRQQLLATTVLMGINRIIVTDGKINAKLKFDFNAADSMNRTGTVDEYEQNKIVYEQEQQWSASSYARGRLEVPVPLKVSTTTGTGVAEIDAHAKLSGEVSINFRSETFPLERMVNTEQFMHLNEAQAGARGTPGPPAAAAPIAPAPAPAPPPAAPPAAPSPTPGV